MIAEMRIGCWAPVHKTKSLRLYADGDLTGSHGGTVRRGVLIWINSTERLISAKKDPGLCRYQSTALPYYFGLGYS